MSYILNLVYILLLLVVSPWLIFCAVFRGKYREGFSQKLLGFVPRRTGDRRCVWFHAVSVGEANLLKTIIPAVESRYPNIECVVSVTTKAAYDLARDKYSRHTIFYCPLDFSWAVNRAMSRIRPKLLVLVELELWPNLIRAAKRHDAKVAIVNGRLSEKSFRGYRRLRSFVAPLLRSLDLIAVQNEDYAARFEQLGARTDSLHITGSIKFDGARLNRDNEETRLLARLAEIDTDDIVFLAGSTQCPEEQFALDAFRNLQTEFPQLRLILVPRHPHRFDEVASLLDDSRIAWSRRSQLESQQTNSHARVLLVDTIGELGAWWATAQIGFVGGSMGKRGGQNMIEPAAYGCAVSFGPNTRNFRDVVEMMRSSDAAHIVNNDNELTDFVRRCLLDPEYAKSLGSRASRLVESQMGATKRTIECLHPLIDSFTNSTKSSHAAA